MLEWWTPANTYETLFEDLTAGRNSAWQRGVVQNEQNTDYYPYLRHYFSHVRMGARRIGASTTDATFAPVAFINTSGAYAVVVKAAIGGSVDVSGLPAGTYGVRYTTGAEVDAARPDVQINTGEILTADIPAAGGFGVVLKAA